MTNVGVMGVMFRGGVWAPGLRMGGSTLVMGILVTRKAGDCVASLI